MNIRRPAVGAVVAAVLAVVLWWMARDVVMVEPPALGPAGGGSTPDAPAAGLIEQTHTDPLMLIAATVAAGVAMVCVTVVTLRLAARRAR